MGKGKEDYYKDEDWAGRGDAFAVKDGKSQAPHLDKNYKCPCGAGVKVEGILRDMGELVEAMTKCDGCGQLHCVLVSKRDAGFGKK